MDRLGILGAGNMGSAILRGISAGELECELFAYDKDEAKLAALSDIGVNVCSSETELVSKCRYVLLAVKPQVLGSVLDTVKPVVTARTVFISICAGISEDFIRSRTLKDAKVVLVMPNTPMMLGMGASAVSTDDATTAAEFDFALSVVRSCGTAEVIPIDKMKEIIAVNGSSPAFIYLFAKSFIDYAADNGIERSAALSLFAATLCGSAKMMTDSGMNLDELIKQVSSPGGTTLAGLEKLREGGLSDCVKAACEACTKRAYELSQ